MLLTHNFYGEKYITPDEKEPDLSGPVRRRGAAAAAGGIGIEDEGGFFDMADQEVDGGDTGGG